MNTTEALVDRDVKIIKEENIYKIPSLYISKILKKPKIHFIIDDYEQWKFIISEVIEGRACLQFIDESKRKKKLITIKGNNVLALKKISFTKKEVCISGILIDRSEFARNSATTDKEMQYICEELKGIKNLGLLHITEFRY